ncbi:MAG: hypothetical protein ACP5VN_03350 [Acidobacteriota bacterium]
MGEEGKTLTGKAIFRFWAPLALTWLMMAVEGPYLAALMARLPNPKANLAAYGVAFVLAMLFESPIIMMLSAATALATGGESTRRLFNFNVLLAGGSTLLMALLALPWVFPAFAVRVLGLPGDVASLAHRSLLVLLPWPMAIGLRRFYNGVVIRRGLTRLVTAGTVVRLTVMGAAMVFFGRIAGVDGAVAGAAALSSGVVAEAAASRLMAARTLRALRAAPGGEGVLTYGQMARFYFPLALTAVLFLAVNPLVTLFLGRSRMALESLAVLPVVNALGFLFGSAGIAYQEVTIALVGRRKEHYGELLRFARRLGAVLVFLFAVLVFTPLSRFWFLGVSGLREDLAALAVPAARILLFQPALTLALGFLRAVLVVEGDTRPATWATLWEVGGIVGVLFVGVVLLDGVGALVASSAYVLGRAAGVLRMVPPVRRSLAAAGLRLGGGPLPGGNGQFPSSHT